VFPLVFQCQDALSVYREVMSRGIEASEPFVGNGLWNFSLSDPDNYQIELASPTETPEETMLSELAG
jgi:lactoylglutathione lyase